MKPTLLAIVAIAKRWGVQADEMYEIFGHAGMPANRAPGRVRGRLTIVSTKGRTTVGSSSSHPVYFPERILLCDTQDHLWASYEIGLHRLDSSEAGTAEGVRRLDTDG